MVIEGLSAVLTPAVGIGIFVKNNIGNLNFSVISVILYAFAAVIAYF